MVNWQQGPGISRRERRRRRVVNVVVYDRTQTGPGRRAGTAPVRPAGLLARLNPFSLAFWWVVGGRLFRVLGRADVTIGAAGWTEAWEAIAAAAEARGPDAQLGTIQFWGHGGDGTMWIAGDAFDWTTLDPETPPTGPATAVRDRLSRDHGFVWFRGCNTFCGSAGHAFAARATDFFGVPVAGHTFVIWLLHSGTQILSPGATPGWPAAQGYGDRKPNPWSSPRKANTISMLRFYPPARFVSSKSESDHR